MTRFDGFDTALILSGITLIASATVMGHREHECMERCMAVAPDPSTRQELARAASLLDCGHAEESCALLKNLAARNPEAAEVHVLLGRAFVELKDYPDSIRAFRTSLQLDPEYADPKSQKFAGKAIKPAIAGEILLTKRTLSREDLDPGAEDTLKDAHYLERMLAGGCE